MAKTITNNTKDLDPLVPIPEAAQVWGVSIWTVRAWIQGGKITSNKLGGRRLIPLSEVRRLIETTRVPARSEAA